MIWWKHKKYVVYKTLCMCVYVVNSKKAQYMHFFRENGWCWVQKSITKNFRYCKKRQCAFVHLCTSKWKVYGSLVYTVHCGMVILVLICCVLLSIIVLKNSLLASLNIYLQKIFKTLASVSDHSLHIPEIKTAIPILMNTSIFENFCDVFKNTPIHMFAVKQPTAEFLICWIKENPASSPAHSW